MKDKYPKYLPLGSVVMLNNGKKRLMVTGYAQIDMEKKDKVFDYCGCMFPEGIITTNETILFNHGDIDKIYCLGFSDDEQKAYVKKVKEILTEDNIKIMLDKLKNDEVINNTSESQG